MVGSGLALLVTGETEEVERLLLESSGPSRQSEGALGVDGGHQGVSGQRGEIGQQCAKAVNWQPVLESAACRARRRWYRSRCVRRRDSGRALPAVEAVAEGGGDDRFGRDAGERRFEQLLSAVTSGAASAWR